MHQCRTHKCFIFLFFLKLASSKGCIFSFIIFITHKFTYILFLLALLCMTIFESVFCHRISSCISSSPSFWLPSFLRFRLIRYDGISRRDRSIWVVAFYGFDASRKRNEFGPKNRDKSSWVEKDNQRRDSNRGPSVWSILLAAALSIRPRRPPAWRHSLMSTQGLFINDIMQVRGEWVHTIVTPYIWPK